MGLKQLSLLYHNMQMRFYYCTLQPFTVNLNLMAHNITDIIKKN